MSINHNITLVQPAPAFGATLGKNSYRRWALITPLPLILIAVTIWSYTQPALTTEVFFPWNHTRNPGEGNSVTGWLLATSIAGSIAHLIYTYIVFTANHRRYHEDATRGHDQWVRTEVRDWLNQRYGLKIDARTVENLYDGYRQRITHYDEFGRPEQVLVQLRGVGSVERALWDGEVRDIVDVTSLDPRLEIIEEPAKPRIYEWV